MRSRNFEFRRRGFTCISYRIIVYCVHASHCYSRPKVPFQEWYSIFTLPDYHGAACFSHVIWWFALSTTFSTLWCLTQMTRQEKVWKFSFICLQYRVLSLCGEQRCHFPLDSRGVVCRSDNMLSQIQYPLFTLLFRPVCCTCDMCAYGIYMFNE